MISLDFLLVFSRLYEKAICPIAFVGFFLRYHPKLDLEIRKTASYTFCAMTLRENPPVQGAGFATSRTIAVLKAFMELQERKTVASRCRQHLELFNANQHRIFRRSRREMFESERAFLRPLPETPYEVVTHTTARVHPDCHLTFEKNFYSAPEQYRGHLMDLWAGEKTVEIFY
jgi:hypothetical protein